MNQGYDVDIDQCLFVSLGTGLIHCCPTVQDLVRLVAIAVSTNEEANEANL